MSAERIVRTEKENVISLKIPEVKKKILTNRVDINNLLARVRKQKQKDYFTNLIFFGFFVTLVVVIGIILSL